MVVHDGLTFTDVRFRYSPVEGLPVADVLHGASFTLARGEVGAIIGASDAGKSTLIRVLAGLVPRFTGGALAGTARFGDRDLMASLPWDAMETMGLAFQNPDEQLVTTRCDSEVAFALESLGIPRAEMEARIHRGLNLMGLDGMRQRNPGTLSGGEKKRLLLACLVAQGPQLWLLDEAFQELDAEWREAVLRQIRSEGRTALFLDSRWSPLYRTHCSAAGVLANGRVRALAELETAEELLEAEGLSLAGGSPAPGAADFRGA
ncbi:MAG TPA: ABC transporter ATP-binding protein, partial [Spirochaetia bacterium]|nr:ABC transporter ATP-binding protein [Spirochaetia bacterium]